jgi:hypothetical protein
MSRRASRNGSHHSASLLDFRDFDLMAKMREEGDNDGWLETELLARAVGLGDDHNRHMGIRLGWMRRFGMVERDEQRGLWRLTPGGERVVAARVRAATVRELEALPEEALIETMSSVLQRYRLADAMTATMLRREVVYGLRPR